MPKIKGIDKVLIIGSGPIVIGQACEFDYSGTQACKALRAAGYKIVLVNSNPATIMTDPDMAWKVYIEPLTFTYLEKIIKVERPDALLPTLGGQTALNLAIELYEESVLNRYGVELIGACADSIKMAESRGLFKKAMKRIGVAVPKSGIVRINGVDYTKITQNSIQSRIGIVPQTPHLFSGTIRENVRYGRLDATDEEIEDAARLAGANNFISRLDNGYESEVGEGGDLLSTGQKQLISLARAILAQPEILIMDEATSSVDTLTETLIQQGMENLM